MVRLKKLWIYLETSLWFVPVLIIILGACFAILALYLDLMFSVEFAFRRDASQFLSSVAVSMITIGGVAFSITIVALTQAATQYTTRILRTFMRQRFNQIVIGIFSGIYIYCLFILGSFQVKIGFYSIIGGLLLAIVGIINFILFIHNIATSIQAVEIIKVISKEVMEGLQSSYPLKFSPDEEENELKMKEPYISIPSVDTGYIERIEIPALVALAEKYHTVFRVHTKTGSFVYHGKFFVDAHLEKFPKDTLIAEVNRCFVISSIRTAEQDPEFGIQQLIDIGLKSLSPAVNDHNTAMMVIDSLTAIFVRLAPRRLQLAYPSLENIRVFIEWSDFNLIFWKTFFPLFETSKDKCLVLQKLLKSCMEIRHHVIVERRKGPIVLLEKYIKKILSSAEGIEVEKE